METNRNNGYGSVEASLFVGHKGSQARPSHAEGGGRGGIGGGEAVTMRMILVRSVWLCIKSMNEETGVVVCIARSCWQFGRKRLFFVPRPIRPPVALVLPVGHALR